MLALIDICGYFFLLFGLFTCLSGTAAMLDVGFETATPPPRSAQSRVVSTAAPTGFFFRQQTRINELAGLWAARFGIVTRRGGPRSRSQPSLLHLMMGEMFLPGRNGLFIIMGLKKNASLNFSPLKTADKPLCCVLFN